MTSWVTRGSVALRRAMIQMAVARSLQHNQDRADRRQPGEVLGDACHAPDLPAEPCSELQVSSGSDDEEYSRDPRIKRARLAGKGPFPAKSTGRARRIARRRGCDSGAAPTSSCVKTTRFLRSRPARDLAGERVRL